MGVPPKETITLGVRMFDVLHKTHFYAQGVMEA
jgi:hypothetical protein